MCNIDVAVRNEFDSQIRTERYWWSFVIGSYSFPFGGSSFIYTIFSFFDVFFSIPLTNSVTKKTM